MTDYQGLYVYRYAGEKEDKVILVNSTIHNFKEIVLWMEKFNPKDIFAINRTTGELEKLNYIKDEGKIVLLYPMNGLSTATIIIKKK